MTLKQLNNYISKKRETEMWERELYFLQKNCAMVKDVVRGSSKDYPYTSHPITIAGIPNESSGKEQLFKRRIKVLKRETQEIENFIDGLQDSQLRQIIYYRYIKDYSWVKTAQKIGGNNTEDSVRKRVKRYFEKTL